MKLILEQIKNLCGFNPIGDLNNICAFLKDEIPNLNWVGFYFYQDGALLVGPFSGKVACPLIKIGSGVCGTAFSKKEVLNVLDVHQFSGHIACDSASNSELVLPIFYQDEIIGVFDIDSIVYNNFNSEIVALFKDILNIIMQKIDFKKLENIMFDWRN